MNKKKIQKMGVGDIVTVEWDDAASNRAILLEKPCPCKGDISIICLHLGEKPWIQSIVHGQIVGLCGQIINNIK